MFTGRKKLHLLTLVLLCAAPTLSYAQVVNGDFSAGATGWTDNSPGTTDSNDFSGNQLTATSNDIGATTTGPSLQTFASQGFTADDPGYLSYSLISYTSTDTGDFDFPIVVLDGVQIRIRTDGTLSNTGTLINNDNQVAGISGSTTLAAGARTIGFGVRTVDSGFGPGIAIWDDIAFQDITLSPGAQTTLENNPVTLSGANSPQTATNTTDIITVTLSAANGTVNLGSPGSVTITGGADGSSTVTFTGSPTNINTAMDGLVYTPNTGFSGSDTLVYTASGGGISDTDNIPINVTPGTRTMSVTKTADDVTNVTLGQTITYTYRVTNIGNQIISNVTLSDAHGGSGPAPVPTGETLSNDSLPIGDSVDAGVNASWDTLAPGDEITFTATYVVTQNDIDTLQ